jgi:hypothetical protein
MRSGREKMRAGEVYDALNTGPCRSLSRAPVMVHALSGLPEKVRVALG